MLGVWRVRARGRERERGRGRQRERERREREERERRERENSRASQFLSGRCQSKTIISMHEFMPHYIHWCMRSSR